MDTAAAFAQIAALLVSAPLTLPWSIRTGGRALSLSVELTRALWHVLV